MRPRGKRLISMVCVMAMLLGTLPAVTASAAGSFDSVGGWLETIYAELPAGQKVTAVSYSGASSGSLNAEDLQYLVRESGGKTRIDIPGVKAGTYSLNVTTASGDYAASGIQVYAHDRSGYAHFKYTDGVGAYKDDGTLKPNAIVLYVTEENKNTVELSYGGTTVKGIGNILNTVGRDYGDPANPGKCRRVSKGKTYWGWANTNAEILAKLSAANIPLVVRIVGNVTCKPSGQTVAQGVNGYTLEGVTSYNANDFGGSPGDNGAMVRMQGASNVTIEGVGPDAGIDGWGIHFMAQSSDAGSNRGKSFELRNITFQNVPEDCVGMEGAQEGGKITGPVERCWVHNCAFYAPKISNPAESDKDGGDGACDFKRGQYMTMSYCEYYGYHKTNLIGSADDSLQYNITWHHNYYESCESRGPLVRNSNIHIYNTYFRNQISYAMNPRANAYIFSEYNVFDSCKNSVEIKSGAVKSYHDSFVSTIGAMGATIVEDKSQKVANSCKYASAGIDYSAFDTNASQSYIPSGDYLLDEDFESMMKNITAWAGPMEATVRTPDKITSSNSMAPMEKLPTKSVQLPFDMLSGITSVSSTDSMIFQSVAAPSSGSSKVGGSTARQNIIFTVDDVANIELKGSGIVLASEWNEAIITNSGVAEGVPAGTYYIRSTNFECGKGGQNRTPPKYKNSGVISGLKITSGVPDHTHSFTGPYKSAGNGKHGRQCTQCNVIGMDGVAGKKVDCSMSQIAAAVAMDCRTNTAGRTATMACADCGYQTGGDVIPVEHNYVNGSCTVCHVHEHKWDSGKATTPATCVDPGVMTYTCTAGGCTTPVATRTEVIEPTGVHEYDSNDVCKYCFTKRPAAPEGAYVHNFSENGKDPVQGSIYTITGNLSNSDYDYSYNGMNFSAALKMESSTVITANAPGAGKLILVFEYDSKSIKINDQSVNTTDNVVTHNVTAAGAVTIKKGSGDPRLLYMEFVPEGSSGSGAPVEKGKLKTLINESEKYKDLATSTDGSDVATTVQWTTPAAKSVFTSAFAKAEQVFKDVDATQDDVDKAFADLNAAVTALNPKFGGSGTAPQPTQPPVQPADQVDAVTLNRSAATVKVGGTVQLTATITPSSVQDKTVTWSSSNESVATVSAAGLVTAVAKGSATITATAGGKSATCAVTVPATTSADQNKEYYFKAVDYTKDVTDLDKVSVGTKWVEDFFTLKGADEVPKTTGDGVDINQWRTNWKDHSYLLPLPQGQSWVEFTVPEGKTAKVTVVFTSTSGSNYSAINLLNGDTAVADATGKTIIANKGDHKTTKTVEYTKLAAGTYKLGSPVKVEPADIGMSSFASGADNPNNRGPRIEEIKVTVTTPGSEIEDDTVYVDSVTVTPATAGVKVGETVTLSASVLPSSATHPEVTWSSSNAKIATVSGGVVTGVSVGEVIITATADGVNGLCTVAVSTSGEAPSPTPKPTPTPRPIDRGALTHAIANAGVMKGYATTSGDGADVLKGSQWVSSAAVTAFEKAIEEAQKVHDAAGGTQAQYDKAVADLKGAADTFQAAHKDGTKEPPAADPGKPGGSDEPKDPTPVDPTPGATEKVYKLAMDAVVLKLDPDADITNTEYKKAIEANAILEKQGDEGYFAIHGNKEASDTKNVFTYSKKTFGDGDKTIRLGFGGSANTNDGKPISCIRFTTSGPASVKVLWAAGSTDGRQIGIYTLNEKNKLQETTATEEDSKANQPYTSTVSLSAAGTYYLGCKGGASYLFAVEVTEGATKAKSASEPAAIAETSSGSSSGVASNGGVASGAGAATPTVKPADFTALTSAIAAAKTNRDTDTKTSVDGSDVNTTDDWTTNEYKLAYTIGIMAAEDMAADKNAAQTKVDKAVSDLAAATTKFNSSKEKGSHTESTGGDDDDPGSGGGGGGGGGGGSFGGATTTTVTTKPVGKDVEMSVSGKDGTATLTANQMNNAVNTAAKNNSQNIVVSVSGTGVNGDCSLTVPANALSNMASKTDAKLVVETESGTVKLSTEAMKDLGGKGGSVTLTVTPMPDALKVTVTAGNNVLSSVKGGVTASGKVAGTGTIAVLVNADGTETILKKSYVADGVVHAQLPGSGTVKIASNDKSFRDAEASWAKEAIGFVSSHELFNGVNELDFAPDAAMTRSMLVTVLYRLESAKASSKATFKDIPAGTWYSDAVAWGSETGIVQGKLGNAFGPNDNITREQLATILYRYATKLCGGKAADGNSKVLEKYPDAVVVSEYAGEGMIWCVEQGIIGGRGDGTLAPAGFASRAEVSTMLMRFVKAIL